MAIVLVLGTGDSGGLYGDERSRVDCIVVPCISAYSSSIFHPGRCSRLASEVRPLLCPFLLKKEFFFLSSKLGNWKQASPK